jgi:hypothetical protein
LEFISLSGPQFSIVASIAVDEKGIVIFPPADLEKIPVVDLRVLLDEYLQECWGKSWNDSAKHACLTRNSVHRPGGKLGELPVPWDEIIASPARFYDDQKFALPFSLKSPVVLNTMETLALGEYFNSTRCSTPFYFNDTQNDSPPASAPHTPLPAVEPSTPITIFPQPTPPPGAPTTSPLHRPLATSPRAPNEEATKKKNKKRKR